MAPEDTGKEGSVFVKAISIPGGVAEPKTGSIPQLAQIVPDHCDAPQDCVEAVRQAEWTHVETMDPEAE